MDEIEILKLFDPLFRDANDMAEIQQDKPLFAHYTSLEVLEKILQNKEIWFSNPLFMNDLEEVRFGVVHGVDTVVESKEIENSMLSDDRYDLFLKHLFECQNQFQDIDALDVYVFCVTQHDPEKDDGLLSMWRGYGGNGRGAAIVFDSQKIPFNDDSPLILGKVHYASREGRINYIRGLAARFANLMGKAYIPDSKIAIAANVLFQRIVLFALFSKHIGFLEEHEWRVVYLSTRDRDNNLEPMKGYLNGPRGIEPKLKLKIGPGVGFIPTDVTLVDMIHSIILGPNSSSKLALGSMDRMLELLELEDLRNRVRASEIPLRES